MTAKPTPKIRSSQKFDIPLILSFISELAAYEKLSHEAVASEEDLGKALFGSRPYAEVLIAEINAEPVGFALFFHNFSTFVGKPGIYLEDLYVRPEARGAGAGKALLRRLAQLTIERNCGRLEWSVLDWNEPAINFYQAAGAKPMDEWTVFRLTGEKLHQFAR